MTIENQEWDLSAKGSSAAFHPSVSTRSMEAKAVWQFVQSVFEGTYDGVIDNTRVWLTEARCLRL